MNAVMYTYVYIYIYQSTFDETVLTWNDVLIEMHYQNNLH